MTTTQNRIHAEVDDDESSIDTEEALLQFLGLSNQDQRSSSGIVSPPLSAVIVMDEEEQKGDAFVSSCREVYPIELPPRCSRYGHAPGDCAAVVIPVFYSPSECQNLLRLGQKTGFQYITQASHLAPDGSSYTVQLQYPNPHKLAVMEHSPTIAAIWYKLVHSHRLLQADWMVRFQKRSGYKAPVGLNPRVRVLQYDASDNDRFEAHFDATTQVRSSHGHNQTSRLTVLLYLNTGGGVDFDGGETIYSDAHIGGRNAGKRAAAVKQVKVVPQQGTLVVFEHDLYHSGAPLLWGTKHVMRTDILFDCHENDFLEEEDNNPQETASGSTSATEGVQHGSDDESAASSSVLDLCQEMKWSHREQSILQDMGLMDMTLESFLVPGPVILTELLADGGIDGSSVEEFLKVAQERVSGRANTSEVLQ